MKHEMNGVPGHQTGAALIVSLILLLVMTLLGVSAMQTNILEEKMAGNYRDMNLAFQAAEAALRDGETWLKTLATEPPYATPTDFTNKVWDTATLEGMLGTSPWWETNNTNPFTYGTPVSGLALVHSDPVRVIELKKSLKDSLNIGQRRDKSRVVLYRITSQGIGGTSTTKVILQSIYAKRWP